MISTLTEMYDYLFVYIYRPIKKKRLEYL